MLIIPIVPHQLLQLLLLPFLAIATFPKVALAPLREELELRVVARLLLLLLVLLLLLIDLTLFLPFLLEDPIAEWLLA